MCGPPAAQSLEKREIAVLSAVHLFWARSTYYAKNRRRFCTLRSETC